jgi:hypothetical protein
MNKKINENKQVEKKERGTIVFSNEIRGEIVNEYEMNRAKGERRTLILKLMDDILSSRLEQHN